MIISILVGCMVGAAFLHYQNKKEQQQINQQVKQAMQYVYFKAPTADEILTRHRKDGIF